MDKRYEQNWFLSPRDSRRIFLNEKSVKSQAPEFCWRCGQFPAWNRATVYDYLFLDPEGSARVKWFPRWSHSPAAQNCCASIGKEYALKMPNFVAFTFLSIIRPVKGTFWLREHIGKNPSNSWNDHGQESLLLLSYKPLISLALSLVLFCLPLQTHTSQWILQYSAGFSSEDPSEQKNSKVLPKNLHSYFPNKHAALQNHFSD